MNVHKLILKISTIFADFIPDQNIGESTNFILNQDTEEFDNKSLKREPVRDYYEDLGNPH